MTDRRFYQSIGICPVCKKEKLFGEEKECQACQANRYYRVLNYRRKHPKYDKIKRMETYYRRSEKHQCTNCGIQLANDYQYKMCPKCQTKNKLALRRSRERRGLSGL